MAEATSRPNVKTPLPQRDDLQKLIPDNIRLRRALEQMFIDVSSTLPDSVQSVGDTAQQASDDATQALANAVPTQAILSRIDALSSDIERSVSVSKNVLAKLNDLRGMVDSIPLNDVRRAYPTFVGGATVKGTATAINFTSGGASASCSNGVATTIWAIPNASPATYLVSADLGFTTNDVTNYGSFAIVKSDGSTARLASTNNAALLIISLSGLNLQVTQNSGATQTVFVNFTRVR